MASFLFAFRVLAFLFADRCFVCGTKVTTGALKDVLGEVEARQENSDDQWLSYDMSVQLLQGQVLLFHQEFNVTQDEETRYGLEQHIHPRASLKTSKNNKPLRKHSIDHGLSLVDFAETASYFSRDNGLESSEHDEVARSLALGDDSDDQSPRDDTGTKGSTHGEREMVSRLHDPAFQQMIDAQIAKRNRAGKHGDYGAYRSFATTLPRAYGLLAACVVIIALVLVGRAPDGSMPSQALGTLAPVDHLVKQSETVRTSVVTSDSNHLTGSADLDVALDSNVDVVGAVMMQVRSQPDRVALIDGESGMSMTYEQLGKAIDDMAAALAAKGIKSGETIAVFLPPSPALAIALLGIMHAGCAWLTLDPELPVQRLQTLLTAVNARLAIGLKNVDGLHGFPMWIVDTFGSVKGIQLDDPLGRSSCSTSDADDYVAIFFTSGSSGVPKGVKYSARTLMHGVLSMKRLCNMNESTVALMKTPTIWAVIEYEVFPALVSGGVVVCDSRCQKNLHLLAETLSDHRVTALMTSAPVMRALVEGTWSERSDLRLAAASHLKHVVNVGGALPLETCALVQNALPTSSVHNLYGCTESSCTEWTYKHSTHLGSTSGSAPAGWPQPRVDVFIVDERLEQLPIGQEGEVCFGSEFNSLGYFGDAVLTDQKFCQHPTKPELKMYRTGDLGAFVPDPTCPERLVLQITGRKDRQLNIAGVRVAPEEVEGVIGNVFGVIEVVVVAAESVLVAFFVGESKGEDLASAIKTHCVENLPARMRPELIFALDALPRLRNGKVDLASLSARGKQAVQENVNRAVDSLGMMKNVNKGMLREMNVFSAMRCLSMLDVCLFHWFWADRFLFMNSQNLVSSQATTFAPGWLRWFIRGSMCSQWAMLAFVLMSARTDRQAAEERKPGQIRETCIVFAMMLFGYEALGYLLQLVHDVTKNGVVVDASAGHLWYFGLFITMKFTCVFVLMPFQRWLRTLAPRSGEIARFLFVAAVLSYQCTWHSWPQLDYGTKSHTLHVRLQDAFCYSILWTVYIVAFFYQTQFAAVVLRHWPKKPGCLLPLSLFLAGNCILGYLDEQQKPFHLWLIWSPMAIPQLLIDCCLVGLLMLSLYFLSEGPWLHRLGLIRMGACSLSFYVLHMQFLAYRSPPGEHGVWFKIGNFGPPSLYDAVMCVRPTFGGIGQLVVLLMYPVVFGLTVAPLFQWSFLGCFLAAEKGVIRFATPLFGRRKR